MFFFPSSRLRPVICSIRATRAAGALLTALLLGVFFVSSQSNAADTVPAAGPGRVRLPDSFRTVAPAATVTTTTTGSGPRAQVVRADLTAAEANAPMEVQLVLRMRNAAELERRVKAGETIGRAEMAARFLPTESDYDAVAAWLRGQGLSVRAAGASHAMVTATGTTAQMESVFEAKMARVNYKGAEYTSTTVAPSLPTEIAARVRNLHGLQPHLHPRKSAAATDAVTDNGNPPFYVGDILNAYNVSAAGLTGTGQTIGIIIDTLPLTTDLQKFWSANDVAQSLNNYSTVNVENSTIGAPTGEETLDVEWSSGIASGAKIVVYACGDLNYVDDCYSRVLDDLQAGARGEMHQISMSYGGGEISDESPDDINSVHEMFAAISAYGVSLFSSSGDAGPYGNDEGQVEVCYPASDPLVTGVGGTTLELSAGDTVFNETGWSVSGDKGDHSSSGGGYSTMFDRPSYQVGTGVNTNAMRQVPDVSIVGDPGTGCIVFFNGKSEQDGGTSLSTPIWAGLCALINQGRAAQGLSPLTGLNPSLYPQLGTSSFRDITSGTSGLYSCTTGYDLLTGLGVPDFDVLYKALLTGGAHAAFFTGETALTNGVYYLSFPDGNYFGYYSYLSNPRYIYHFDLGYEYWFDANDGKDGIYFYDFASQDFFYTSPTFPFPYLYDFTLNTVLYYYPDPSNAGHYNTNGVRYFYDFATGKIISR